MIDAFFALLFAMVPVQTPVTGAGAIEGTVCETQTCMPISGARVVVSAIGSSAVRRTAVTDIGGRFRFLQLPPGRYGLRLEADDYIPADILPVITVTDGTLQTVKIEMHAQGTISGRAYDVNGEPLAGARVDAMAFRRQGHYQMLMPVASADTDDRGEYRIPSLEPDEYYIRVSPPAYQVIKNSYPATWYPNVTDPAGATHIDVTRGREVSGIDTRLPSHGVKVRGRIMRPEKDRRPAVLTLLPRMPAIFVMPAIDANTMDETTDDFELRGVAPGSYYLYAITAGIPESGSEWVRMPIEVGDKDVEDVTLTLIPAGSIKGRVTTANDASDTQNLDYSRLTFNAESVELVPGVPRDGFPIRVAANAEFQLRRLSERKLYLRDQVLQDSWFISSVRFDGNDALTGGFSTTPGKESVLEVVISNAGGTLTGVVKDAQNKPAPAGRIVLLPDRSLRTNPFLIRTGVAIEGGVFAIEVIPPGEYTAVAFPDRDEFTPAFLRDMKEMEKYEPFGQPVHIGPRETTRLDLTVVQ